MAGKINLKEILKGREGERHLVVLHEYPDPDAIACGYAHQMISRAGGIECDIVYLGEISHQQNIALVKLLGGGVNRFTPELNVKDYQAAVFVDNQGTTVEPVVQLLETAGVPVLLVVDHHPPQDRLKAEYADLRATGATATIYADYLEHGPLELDKAEPEHVLLATALMHGLISDTQSFLRASPEDFQAAAFFSRYQDVDTLVKILSQRRSKHVMDIIQRALGNREEVDSFMVSGIGYVRAEDRDAIPQAADFLLSEENVHTVMVYGILSNGEGEELVGSLRTTKFTLDPDDFIKDVFGKGADGRYRGGGRELAGGFTIPLGFLSESPSDQMEQLKWELYDAQIKHKVYNKIGVQPPE